jgi:hypothetical protein
MMANEILYIFDSIEVAWEYVWNERYAGKYRNATEEAEHKNKKWEFKVKWMKEYTRLVDSIIPKNRIACMMEGKQQYKDFTPDEILHVIKSISELAKFMGGADQSVFEYQFEFDHDKNHYNPMTQYYMGAMKRIMWMVATFTNPEKDHCSFIGMDEILEGIFDNNEAELKGKCHDL